MAEIDPHGQPFNMKFNLARRADVTSVKRTSSRIATRSLSRPAQTILSSLAPTGCLRAAADQTVLNL